MESRRRFCLVTPAHVCNNPRLVKEADALHAAGHEVRVVSLRSSAAAAARDATVMATRAWRLDVVDVARDSARLRWLGWGSRSAARSARSRSARAAGSRAISR